MTLTDKKYQSIHLIILITVVILFWNTLLVYPIKLFVVMLHEMSHGLMAIAFGGQIIEIQISKQIGGYCLYSITPSFWSSFMTGSAGYLGSLFWGALILILAVKSEKDKYITLVIGMILLALSYFVMQSGEFFGTTMTFGLGLFMLIAFKYFGNFFHDLWLKFLGIISCAYVILDIKGDLIDNSNIGSDADAIAVLTGLPSAFIGIVWMCIALITMFIVLRYVYKKQNTNI
ncbi:M50 family metallopeptidase [Psychroserpens sp. NJDZ02]|uniref:M50 family metallopeptidase n=1 Tax=Psychroserpens sp. NJDZ02 TaxID=2570561 RepID=UPI0010A8B72B|nr:M50 family metallopeptidase [Psychroserpens sp. NJDZ02]QCE42011.1 M50 family metallopeptidase [Psychroserpens sp. NJDZ02]